ncbi:hypothetical protein BU24DRAFT_129783 [Aaosphaeria arxii CBS 175.79]|uniref:N-acetyltransferase domain-containing protein n=1 Tax=Aaosphaeria arxii CBS 175.79 TaxID=1450172 RepID=A0A6A5Y307_9PLEO|nr:uncharacterized protein BU24DRAFT_129783 [Aaosphaeria arxii CBS 175.79]KAF2019932.1 hypothetical protein BU24DRAFT_129783 [Aaosphaeria arxii CBS 175.79]
MPRQLPPTHLRVPSAPSLPPRFQVSQAGAENVVINHYNTEKLIPTIPGFRTSAAFLTSLSANLRIDPDLPSPLLTPNNFRTGAGNTQLPLPPPSPLAFQPHHHETIAASNPYPSPPASASSSSSLSSTLPPSSMSLTDDATSPPTSKPPSDDLPELTTYTATTDDEKISGLRLIADSVAQQRQLASRMLLAHPFNLAAYVLTLAILTQYFLKTRGADPLILLTTVGGLTMACLAAVRMAVGGYLTLAEDVNWEWLGEDRMLVVKWGGEIIGALVLGWEDSNEAGKKRGGGRRRRGKAVVRAWTVKLKYRGKGVGEGLLEEAVAVAGERGADGIVFDRRHANAQRVLPAFYNGFLDRRDERASKALEKVADEKGNFRQRRSSPTWGSR